MMSGLDQISQGTFIRDLEFHAVLDSTNRRGMELAAVGVTETPLMILAQRQTAGRGRGSNQWWSKDGALTFSLVLEASSCGLSPAALPQLSLLVGIAVGNALAKLAPGTAVGLKWPNDVFLGRRKVCGILIESVANYVVVGIGINVNNSFRDAPAELQEIGVACCDAVGKELDLQQVLVAVLRAIPESIESHTNELSGAWRRRCILTGRTVAVSAGTNTTVGVCQGIDDQGALLLLHHGPLHPRAACLVS